MLWIYGLVLFQLLVVSWFDIKTKKISNWWFLGNFVSAMVLYFFRPEVYPFSWEVLLFPFGWLVGGFFLYSLGIMGAGDSKYISSLFLLTPLDFQEYFMEALISVTLVVGVIVLSLKFFKDFKKIKAYAFSAYWSGVMQSIRSHFSYAPVVLLAWIKLGVKFCV